MRFDYRRLRVNRPIPTMPGATVRYKPVFHIRIEHAGVTWPIAGLLDSGADDTVFPRSLANKLGISLSGLPVGSATSAGSKPVEYAVAAVTLGLHDGTQGCQWNALVGFRLDDVKALPLFGQAGFLQFFDADLRGDAHEAILTPNSSFAGTRV